MDKYVFFRDRWKLIAYERYMELLIFISTLSLFAGVGGGFILGSNTAARKYDVRLAAMDSEVAALAKRVIQLQRADESLKRLCGTQNPLP